MDAVLTLSITYRNLGVPIPDTLKKALKQIGNNAENKAENRLEGEKNNEN
jgi:phage-related holin